MVRLKRGWRQVPHAVLGKAKLKERQEAIDLRAQGFSYSEILKKVSVAKSTLSLWLRSVGLSKQQEQRLTEKRRSAQLRGAAARRTQRIAQTAFLMQNAAKEITNLTKREKLLIGVMLYWAEGSKQREGSWGVGIQFTNSDHRMLRLFQRWLLETICLDASQITYEIYLHTNHRHRLAEVQKFWANQLQVSLANMSRVYYKKDRPQTNRKNTGNGYYGLIRIRVRSSSALNRTVSGWIEGVVRDWGVV